MPNSKIMVLCRNKLKVDTELADGYFLSIDKAAEFKPEIAVIANPAPFHISSALPLVEAGAHLLVEKPISTAAAGVKKLIDKCKKNRVILSVGYNLRYLPSLQYFREQILSNIIGNILSVRSEVGQYLPSWRPKNDYRLGVTASQALGGGALLELSHEIDYLRWIFGEVEWVEGVLIKQSNLEINVEDIVHIVLGYRANNSDRRFIGTLNMDIVRHDSTRICTVIGEMGSLRWNGIEGTVEILKAGEKEWHIIFNCKHSREDSYRAEWLNLIDCINKNIESNISGNDGLKVMKIIDAVRQASKKQGRVRVKV